MYTGSEQQPTATAAGIVGREGGREMSPPPLPPN